MNLSDPNTWYGYMPTTIEEIKKLYSDEELLNYYYGDFEPDVFYPSPFREETKGSFIIDYYDNNWRWRDFGLSTQPKDGFEFVLVKYDLTISQTILKIHSDLSNSTNRKIFTKKKAVEKEKNKIACKLWIPKEEKILEYWKKHGLETVKELKHYNIYSGIVFLNEKIVMKSTKYKTVVIFLFDKVTKSWKGYNPDAKENELRFFSNNITTTIQNWKELDNDVNIWGKKYDKDIMFITSSYKDAIVINKLGYHAVAPQSENSFLNPWDLDYLKTRFKHIYVFYDNDSTGVDRCKEYTQQNNLYYINIPQGITTTKEGFCKDPADVVYNYNYKLLQQIVEDRFIRDNL